MSIRNTKSQDLLHFVKYIPIIWFYLYNNLYNNLLNLKYTAPFLWKSSWPVKVH